MQYNQHFETWLWGCLYEYIVWLFVSHFFTWSCKDVRVYFWNSNFNFSFKSHTAETYCKFCREGYGKQFHLSIYLLSRIIKNSKLKSSCLSTLSMILGNLVLALITLTYFITFYQPF